MKDFAELVKVRMFGKNMYQVNFIDPKTGMYRNCSSEVFGSIDEALEYIGTSHELKSSCAKLWSVKRIECSWEYSERFNSFVWVEKSAKRVTPYRTDKKGANLDFELLGFVLDNRENAVQCNDRIIPGQYWIRHIVQVERF